jgi:hypothetical protein
LNSIELSRHRMAVRFFQAATLNSDGQLEDTRAMEALELWKWTEMGDVARHVGFPEGK